MAIIYDWDTDKNEKLITERGISFEEVIALVEAGQVVDVIEHPNRIKYPHQQVYVLEINGYIYFVPFVKDKEKIFLKTIIPSRKATKKYLND